MAHFAKLDSNNIVERVEVVNNDVATGEETGIIFLKGLYGSDTTYDETKDAFIAPKPYSSWVFNETTCVWEAPIEKPDNDKIYDWNEENTQWDLVGS